MYTRLVRFSLGPGNEAQVQELAEELGPLISVQPGCQAVTVFGDHGEGDYGVYVLWDTQEHADTAAGIVRPRLNEHIAGIATAPPETRLFEGLGQLGVLPGRISEGVSHRPGVRGYPSTRRLNKRKRTH